MRPSIIRSRTVFQQTRNVMKPQAKCLSSIKQEAIDTRPQFLITEENGFLPRKDPVVTLPAQFEPVETLLREFQVKKEDGSPGLLAKGQLGEYSKTVPDFTKEIEGIQDTGLLNALFRDYTFWASGYLLEPCHQHQVEKKGGSMYGLGRDVLPLNISSPLLLLAAKLGSKPFMEYAQSYALYNYQRKDPAGPLTYDNLKLIRSFSGSEAESGFILVHVAMVAYSKGLVSSTIKSLDAVRNEDRAAFLQAMTSYRSTLHSINGQMEGMWSRSDPAQYQAFRTFIMGIKDQPMFPNGVLYEQRDPADPSIVLQLGPLAFRGESGANDNIIPTSDNLLQLTDSMPSNPLTEILKDFRSYRPIQHTAWLSYVHSYAQQVQLKRFALHGNGSTSSSSLAASQLAYLGILDEVRDFRHRHWNFTKEYIVKRSKHPVATGGSPIVQWLPNQLGTTLRVMEEVAAMIELDELPSKEMQLDAEKIKMRIGGQAKVLQREVQTLQQQLLANHA